MKTILSIICALTGTIVLPLAIDKILKGDDIVFYSVACLLLLPGYITALLYLTKKYDW